MKAFYMPSLETLDILNRPWTCAYSGGKDSTSLVTWIEWLRRASWITCDKPALILSDTGVEYPFLLDTSKRMMDALSKSGWYCSIVKPRLQDKLFNSIFGRGVPPVHPAMKNMRWCTRATKIDPMGRSKRGMMLTGSRYGESKMRDGKLGRMEEKFKVAGCSAGGECGLPEPGSDTYAPIIHWSTCQVVDWLSGLVVKEVRDVVSDLLELMKEVVNVYEIKKGQVGFGLVPPKINTKRFGCVGCPALGRDKVMLFWIEKDESKKPLVELYQLWDLCRRKDNRVIKMKRGKVVAGPIKMEIRKQLFARLLLIQEKSGLELVNKEDREFIRKCWDDKVYPRGWSIEDEFNSIALERSPGLLSELKL